MAWRGRGRGRGFGGEFRNPGDFQNQLQPPQLYPKLNFDPLPIKTDADFDWMATWKSQHRIYMKNSKFYLKEKTTTVNSIERYSDKYINRKEEEWQPDFNRIPKELWTKNGGRKKKKRADKEKIKLKKESILHILEKLEDAENGVEDPENPSNKTVTAKDDSVVDDATSDPNRKKKDGLRGDHDNEEGEGGSDDDDDDEEEDNFENEEDNDYVENYFENGEDYGVESDGSNDEPIF